MKLNVLLSVTAVYLALLGLGFIFAPLTIGAGAVPADARPSLIAFRADTSLALISDSEFQEGQAAIELAAAKEHTPAPVVERVELLVFKNDRV